MIWLAESDWESLDDVPHSVIEQAKALIRRTSHVLFMDSSIAMSGAPIRVSDLAPPLPGHPMTGVYDLARLDFGAFDATEVVVIDATTSGSNHAG